MNSRKGKFNQFYPPLALSSLEDSTEDVGLSMCELTTGPQNDLGIDYSFP
jgi:hypothetical protein